MEKTSLVFYVSPDMHLFTSGFNSNTEILCIVRANLSQAEKEHLSDDEIIGTMK